MRLSQLFTKTTKHVPAQEVSANARLLLRGGFVYRNLAGVWSLLPLGVRVLHNIERIIREELDGAGCQELLLNNLQAKDVWESSGRWQSLKGDMYQFKDPGGAQVGLGFTHEEVIAHIAKAYMHSADDLPQAVYQIQKKFRYEPRPRSGLLRGREFGMNDLYSFHRDTDDLNRFYQSIVAVYKKIFKRMSLDVIVAEASGGVFSHEYSHEFQVVSEAGEDTIYVCDQCDFARNKELMRADTNRCPTCKKGKVRAMQAIEVGNTFKLGTKYAQAADLAIDTPEGRTPVVMASYGIGTTRLVGAITETNYDESGIIWPKSIAPYLVHLIVLGTGSEIVKRSDALYRILNEQGIATLYDDRRQRAGATFADADLIGCPLRVVVSQKAGERIELKHRNHRKTELTTVAGLIDIAGNI
ncbi:hypothetical protein HY065_01100 [Candidatus Berkelbacteria bacterium]|nr:hypothetical protein [Candidatus Berkelbacteria bacterium]